MSLFSPYRHVNLNAQDWDTRGDDIWRQFKQTTGNDPDPREVQAALEGEIVLELFKFPDELRHVSRNKQPHQVCVIGGGIAGLAAAYELAVRGHNVRLLEASSRLGGRILTHRFGGGTYGELGAMRIPQSHGCVGHYVDQWLADKKRPFVSMNNNAYLFLRNHRTRLGQSEEWKGMLPLYKLNAQFDRNIMNNHPLATEGKMVEDLSNDLTYHYFAQILQDFTIPKSVELLEQTSVWQLMQGIPNSRNHVRLRDAAYEYLGHATGMIWFGRTSFLQYMLNELPLKWPEKYELQGGMDTLVEAFRQNIDSARRRGQTLEVKTGAPVKRLYHRDPKVEVTWQEGKRECKKEFDFVICTTPAAATTRIGFDPPLPPSKHEALMNLSYASAAKTIIRCTKRFWELDGIYGGGTYADLPHQQSWYPSDNSEPQTGGRPEFGSIRGTMMQADWKAKSSSRSNDPSVFTAAYMWEANARRFASLTNDERTELILGSLRKVHPEIESFIKDPALDVVHWAWDSQSSPGGGAWASFAPGEQRKYQRAICEPVFLDHHGTARVLFAGEHLAVIHGWIQSAIQSSLSAVMHILGLAV